MNAVRLPGALLASIALGGLSLGNRSALADESGALDEVVVTARKVEENLQKIPVSVTALSADALAEHSIRNLSEIQSQVPNLLLKESAVEPQALTLAMRGQEQNDIPLTADPSVGIYIDGLYYPRTLGLKGALVDLDRVEILRGPQGTLYGRNTTGGALSLYTANPTFNDGGSIEVGGGNYNAWDFTAVGNAAVNDFAAFRVVVEHDAHSGYGEDAAGRGLESQDGWMTRAKLLLKFGSNVQALLFANYQQDTAGGGLWKLNSLAPASSCPSIGLPGCAFTLESAIEKFGPGILAPGNPNAPAQFGATIAQLQSYIGSDPYRTDTTTPSDSKFYGSTVGVDVKADLSEHVTIRSITGYERLNRNNNFDTDGTPFTGVTSNLLSKDRYVSQELQLLGTQGSLSWLGGLYFGNESGSEGGLNSILPFLLGPEIPIQFTAGVRNETYAAFAQTIWEFIPTWRLTTGVRYSWDDRRIVSDNTQGAIGCVVPAPGVIITPPGDSQCPRTFENKFSAPSWTVSLDHQLTEDLFGYAKVARSYRSGGENFRGANTPESFAPFNPEYVTEYELGAKTEFLQRRLRLNAAIYNDNYSDIQRSISIPTAAGVPTTRISNAASAKIRGVELEGQWQAIERLTFSLAGGYTDAYYTKFTDPLLGDLSQLPFAFPHWTANAGARYQLHVPGGTLALQTDYRWQSAQVLVPQNLNPAAFTQPGYGLLDARATWHFERYDTDIAVYGKNLADKVYATSGASLEASVGFGVLVIGQPRVVGAQITKHFGN
jgi:iron complex outermembrane recepter protein